MANSRKSAEEVALTDDAERFLKQSSAVSVATYEYDSKFYKDRMDQLMCGDLGKLVDAANVLVGNLAANDKLNRFEKTLVKTQKDIELSLHKVLDAMLHHAESCGGDSAKRYVAAAICACVVEPKPEDKVDDKRKSQSTLYMLRQLGKTWFTHFLFPFYFSHSAQPNQTPSPIAMPSLDQTTDLLKSGVKSRKSSFRDHLLLRDAYKCIATDIIDGAHPRYQGDFSSTLVTLEACHVLRRAVANFDREDDEDAYKSAMTTFDILRHFAALPESTLKALQKAVDDPSNGFLLQKDAHAGFDQFRWYLLETETPNRYKIKLYRPLHGVRGLEKPDAFKFVEFEDHSSEFSQENEGGGPSTGQKRKEREFSVPLLDPRWIRLHAGIAGVVNMSGAAKFLDELYKTYRDHDEAPPVRSWEEFERLNDAEDCGWALQSAMVKVTAH